jgi:hypothetical protein
MRLVRSSVFASGLLLAGVVFLASSASAFNLRVPQIGFSSGSLQGYLNANDGGINVLTDQIDAQVWDTSISGNSTFTLMIELAGNAPNNAIGIYNTNGGPVPPLFQVFPGAATAGWFATAHFSSGNMVVTLFDNNSIIQGQTFFAGVNANGFGFYLQGPGGTFYSEDSRNAGAAQMLTYAGTGNNFGDWWMCMEDLPFVAASSDFDDAILLLQSVVPTPVDGKTWGAVKALYR